MRLLKEDEKQIFYQKLINYIGPNIKLLLESEDNQFLFVLHKQKVYYVDSNVYKAASVIGRDGLLALGTYMGKFTKTKKFRLYITCLNILAKYALYKIWIKPNGEQSFLYANHVIKAHLARMTENVPKNAGVVIYSMSDLPLGFGVTAKSTDECRELEPTGIVAINQCDLGEYLRIEND